MFSSGHSRDCTTLHFLRSRLKLLQNVNSSEPSDSVGREACRHVPATSTFVAGSHAIKKLEAQLQVPLFARRTREVSLSAQGEWLLAHVQRGLAELRQGIALVSDSPPAPLRLHTAPSFATQWLIPRLAGFVSTHPGIDLRFSASTDYAQFDNDDYDLDIVYGEESLHIEHRLPLLIEEVTPLCSPEVAKEISSMADLYRLPLIQSTGKSVRWPHWFELNGARTPTLSGLGFDRSSMAIVAATDGLGVVLESNLLTERERREGRLVAPLADQTLSIRYVGHHLVQSRRANQPAAMDQFKLWLLKELSAAAQ
ncbi:LysR substrate-binding domain-containing protein [Stenotrophomonas sp. FR012]|uniref:LysR substrate-binding domain-containing protein n=1 Tax=Stenotrophomonas sp. FR012 TaxID=3398457 RepID=UPI0039C6F9A0